MDERKSTTVARILSFIPGLGHIYVGAYPAGFIWLIISQGLLSLVYVEYTNIKVTDWNKLIIVSIYILIVVWCMIQSSRLATERNATQANQQYFESRKYADETKRVEEMKKMLGKDE
ncbi:MAG: hypothetical protein N3A72_01490 [bacterium]|nr:hypothetical protein [bacterium]